MGTPNYAQYATQNEKERKRLVQEGETSINKAYAGYTPQWYQQREQAYGAFARPQLAQQYKGTRDAQLYGVANRGLLGGSASQQGFANLNRTNMQAQQGIVDAARGYGQDLQRQVEARKSGDIGMLYSAVDPANATMQLTQTAAQFRPNQTMQPVANMFGDIAQQYYMKQLMDQYRQSSQTTSVPGLYTSGSGLPSVTPSYGR